MECEFESKNLSEDNVDNEHCKVFSELTNEQIRKLYDKQKETILNLKITTNN